MLLSIETETSTTETFALREFRSRSRHVHKERRFDRAAGARMRPNLKTL
jgi:hypothetical protein